MTLPTTRTLSPIAVSLRPVLRLALWTGLLILAAVAVSFLPHVARLETRLLDDPGSLPFILVAVAAFGLTLVALFLRRNWVRRVAERLAADYAQVLALTPVLAPPCGERRWQAPLLWVLGAFGASSVLLAFFDPCRYEIFTTEDGYVEHATACLFALAAVLSVRGLVRASSAISRSVYGLITLFLFVCAGEEISWGQRLFGFASPEALEALNKQGETNLHDLGSISVFANAFFVLTLVMFVAIPFLLRRLPGLHTYLSHYGLPRVHPGLARLFLVGLGVWIVIGVRFGTLGFHPFSVWGYYSQMDDEMFEFVAAYCFFAFVLLDQTCACVPGPSIGRVSSQ